MERFGVKYKIVVDRPHVGMVGAVAISTFYTYRLHSSMIALFHSLESEGGCVSL